MKIIGLNHSENITKYLIEFKSIYKPFRFIIIYHDVENNYFSKDIIDLDHRDAFTIYNLMAKWYDSKREVKNS